MSLDPKSTEDLVRIAAAGGGFEIDASARPTEDLIRIAAAAAHRGARITLFGLGALPVDDLARIAGAGRSAVVFAE